MPQTASFREEVTRNLVLGVVLDSQRSRRARERFQHLLLPVALARHLLLHAARHSELVRRWSWPMRPRRRPERVRILEEFQCYFPLEHIVFSELLA